MALRKAPQPEEDAKHPSRRPHDDFPATSREDSVQEPARRHRDLRTRSMQPGSEQPEAAAVHVLDAVIVAERAFLFASPPPFAEDTLGSVRHAHAVQAAAPAEQ